MSRRAEIASAYARIGRTYLRWAPSLLLLAAAVFVPLGFVHAITIEADIGEFDLGGGLKLFALLGAVLAVAATGLLGEVFYAGAVAISLTRDGGRRPLGLREIARTIRYGPLIAVDLIYGVLVALGIAAFVVPGALVFVWLGLAAPVIEIERRGVREAFARSVRLVRGKFLLVAAVLIPIEVVGDSLTSLATGLTHSLFDSDLLGDWVADTLANIAFTPFYAVACVLLTVDRIRAMDGDVVELHSGPPQ